MRTTLTEKEALFLDAQERQIEAMNALANSNDELTETLREIFADSDMTGWNITEAIAQLAITQLRNQQLIK